MMNGGEVVELVYRYVDNDQALIQKIRRGCTGSNDSYGGTFRPQPP